MLLIGIRQALYASTEIADYCPLGKVRDGAAEMSGTYQGLTRDTLSDFACH